MLLIVFKLLCYIIVKVLHNISTFITYIVMYYYFIFYKHFLNNDVVTDKNLRYRKMKYIYKKWYKMKQYNFKIEIYTKSLIKYIQML